MTIEKFEYNKDGNKAYAKLRLAGIRRPLAVVHPADPNGVTVLHDQPIVMRDGVTLRANVHLPTTKGPFPVILAAHPYGKDNVPKRNKRGGYKVSFQFRALRMTGPVLFSDLTTWEAPDPEWWARHGYAVVNLDLRGAGTSEGKADILSVSEGQDIYEVIEWAAKQDWSTGAIGMFGVSYLAIAQYQVATLKPPHLKAIAPWDGFTDMYRDLMRPGGVLENGFIKLWSAGLRKVRMSEDFKAQQKNRPLRDEWWQAKAPDLSKIDLPMLVCASFSDNNLHNRGTWRAFMNASSKEQFAYTHRGGRWELYYTEPALSAQVAFFDRYLKNDPAAPKLPPVRLEIRESQLEIAEVRDEQEYPLARTQWTPLHLGDGSLTVGSAPAAGEATFATKRQRLVFDWTVPKDLDLIGPMSARLWVSSPDLDDVSFVVGVEKWKDGRHVPFEGSYGWGRDRVTTGWQRAALRELDVTQSTPQIPVHTFTNREPLEPGKIVEVPIALGHSATRFSAGDRVRFVIAGRWLASVSLFTGQFPAHYVTGPHGHATVHWGKDTPSQLLVPIVQR